VPKQLQLLQGAYVARSVIANAQRCINLYPERNTEDAEVPITHYLTPGLLLQLTPSAPAQARQYYFTTLGQLFMWVGSEVYYVPNNFVAQLVGSISSNTGYISADDNGAELVFVDGVNGWVVDLTTYAMTQIVDATFLSYGANRVRYLDTYFVFSSPTGNVIFCTNSNSLTFNPLAVYTKSGYSDPLQVIAVTHREIWALGSQTTEILANVGTSNFPFAPVPGVFIQHGVAAPDSLATWSTKVFWVAQDNWGQATIMMGEGYKVEVISTPAIVQAISEYATIADAVGFCYQQGGHVFYQVSFPTGDATWVYDVTTNFWHQRACADAQGQLHRHWANCTAFAYGLNLVGDWSNGNMYAYDLDTFNDNGTPIQRIRSFPHDIKGLSRRMHLRFVADMEVGMAQEAESVDWEPLITLRWSDDRGQSWGNGVLQRMGRQGQYLTVPTWNRLGMARDRVYELSWSENCSTALNGAFVEVAEAAT